MSPINECGAEMGRAEVGAHRRRPLDVTVYAIRPCLVAIALSVDNLPCLLCSSVEPYSPKRRLW